MEVLKFSSSDNEVIQVADEIASYLSKFEKIGVSPISMPNFKFLLEQNSTPVL